MITAKQIYRIAYRVVRTKRDINAVREALEHSHLKPAYKAVYRKALDSYVNK